MQKKMIVVMPQNYMFCIWPNGTQCPMAQRDEFIAVHGEDFLYAILLDEEDVVDLSESIDRFWEKQKGPVTH